MALVFFSKILIRWKSDYLNTEFRATSNQTFRFAKDHLRSIRCRTSVSWISRVCRVNHHWKPELAALQHRFTVDREEILNEIFSEATSNGSYSTTNHNSFILFDFHENRYMNTSVVNGPIVWFPIAACVKKWELQELIIFYIVNVEENIAKMSRNLCKACFTAKNYFESGKVFLIAFY